jgi:probable rRNA maturation factor
LKIRIFYDQVKFRLKGSKQVLNIIEKVIRTEKMYPDDLIFIITVDEEIRRINNEFLNHDYYTDVIAFDYNEGNILRGEVYISLETVKRNSIRYEVSLREELLRVMIHGTLHLCGYDDKNDYEREIMFQKGESWILKFKD